MVTQSHQNNGGAPRSALQFVLWFGVVNLFADTAYKGALSVIGPFLATLGASGLIVGAVTGFGEFLGYAFRLVSRGWADRSRLYWPITLVGYVIQMVSVPLLALTGTWPHASVPILFERAGRATRTSPRDYPREFLDYCAAHLGVAAELAALAPILRAARLAGERADSTLA